MNPCNKKIILLVKTNCTDSVQSEDNKKVIQHAKSASINATRQN